MKVHLLSKRSKKISADILVFPFSKNGKKKPKSLSEETLFQKEIDSPLSLGDFKAGLGETSLIYSHNKEGKRILLLGLGDEINVESLRRAYSKLCLLCHQKKFKKIAIWVPQLNCLSSEETNQGICEGLFLTNYVFENLKTFVKERTSLVSECTFIGLEKHEEENILKWKHLCDGVCLARDLINGNADDVRAPKLVEVAKQLSQNCSKMKAKILDKKNLEKEQLNLMLAVNRGASVDPALILLHYKGNSQSKKTALLAGKGITYDSGGLQLKPRAGSIIHMKADMGGAAAVLGVFYAVAKLDLKINLAGVIPVCENAIGPDSYKPGDVYMSYLGKSVEIISTDAEGRLVLADAMAYAIDYFKPDVVVDIATLTGGVVSALGDKITGIMSNNKLLVKTIQKASSKSGEPVWELPLLDDYKEGLKSSIADLKNAVRNPSYPSAVIAGLFLQEFVKKTPWAHLDIAGTAYLADPKYYHRTKATGVGVRLLLAFLENLSDF